MNNRFENTLDFARQLDAADPLQQFRKEFIIPELNGRKQIYFLGNSLGLQPVRTKSYLQKILDGWSALGVEAFFLGDEPWLNYHDQLTKPLSKLVGAGAHEVVVMSQLTINLHLMLASFYQPTGKRNKIICEAKAFPSDQYMLETHVKHRGLNPDEVIVEVKPREGKHVLDPEDIYSTIEKHKDEVALVLWAGVDYYTGQHYDLQQITAAAQKAGAKVGLDLAHAAGNITLQLHDWNVDFACWCSYKYLNSGPGGIGGVYIHERYHTQKDLPRLAGWWGYDKSTRFLMQKGFVPMQSAEGWQVSTPSPLLYAAHRASLEIFEEAGWDKIQAKSKLLFDWLCFVLDEVNKHESNHIVEFITPRNEGTHGSQLSMFMLRDGKKIFEELFEAGIMTDWREPNVIRLAPVPLYNTYEEVWQFAHALSHILQQHVQHA
jgi:kynureninase